MKKVDKVIVAILSIWTFIHCYLIIQAINYPQIINAIDSNNNIPEEDWISYEINKSDMFYPFTRFYLPDESYFFGDFCVEFYDYSEFFVYVVGAWGLFLLYKLLSPKKY
jgi:hypothetical protein